MIVEQIIRVELELCVACSLKIFAVAFSLFALMLLKDFNRIPFSFRLKRASQKLRIALIQSPPPLPACQLVGGGFGIFCLKKTEEMMMRVTLTRKVWNRFGTRNFEKLLIMYFSVFD